jgi:hypothetical protein
MLRKTLMTLMAFAALGIGSPAMAGHGGGGGGGGGGHGGMGGGGGYGGGGFGGMGMAHGPAGGPGPGAMSRGFAPGTFNSAGPMATAPMNGGRVQGWSGRTAWGNNHFHDHFHDRFHNRFRNRNFFAFGVGGPYYDYAYNSCWTQVPTSYGWRWVYVCGDYGY